jgi:hypothetical protein
VVVDGGRQGSATDGLDDLVHRHAQPSGSFEDRGRAQELEEVFPPEKMHDIEIVQRDVIEQAADIPIGGMTKKELPDVEARRRVPNDGIRDMIEGPVGLIGAKQHPEGALQLDFTGAPRV